MKKVLAFENETKVVKSLLRKRKCLKFDKTEILVVVDRSFIHTDRKTPFLELLGMRSVSFDLISSRMESINIGGIFFK